GRVLDAGGGSEDARGVRRTRAREAARVRGIALLLALLVAGVAGPAVALERLPAVLHVHSDLSTGDFSLEQLAALAEKEGIGALLIPENLLLPLEYGPLPFRALTRAARGGAL